MAILAIYNQTFTASQTATFQWTFQFLRRMRTRPNSRFIFKLNTQFNSQTSIVPAIALNQLNIYMSNPELCARADNQLLAPAPLLSAVNNETVASAASQIFICNDFPVTPVVFTARYTSTLLPPTSGTIAWISIWTIYEFDGDIPDNVIL